jgi:hypothetical protein
VTQSTKDKNKLEKSLKKVEKDDTNGKSLKDKKKSSSKKKAKKDVSSSKKRFGRDIQFDKY